MTQAEMKIQLDKLAADFRTYSIKAETAVDEAVLWGSMLVMNTAKRSFRDRREGSWSGSLPRAQTSYLKRSITYRLERKGDAVIGDIGTNVDYALGLEKGTSKTYPHPYMEPALIINQSVIIDKVKAAIRGVS